MAEHRVVHFEIAGDDPARLTKFYADFLNWKIEKVPSPGFEYWVCKTGTGPGIDGGIMKRMHPQHTITNYIDVENVDAMVTKAQSLGATLMKPKSPVTNMGWFAILQDPQGNPLGLWQTDKSAK
jgi:predicted enzyme related to lactoylglutathione lyase